MASNRIYGTCAFCHGDPCAERPQGALYSPIHHEYQLWKTAKWMNDLMRSEGFSCPLCDGRPSVRADLACEPGHLVREQRQLVDHLVDPTGQLPCPRWVVVRFGFLVLRNDIRLTR